MHLSYSLCTHEEQSGDFSSAAVFPDDVTFGFHSKMLNKVYFLPLNFTLIFCQASNGEMVRTGLTIWFLQETLERLLV